MEKAKRKGNPEKAYKLTLLVYTILVVICFALAIFGILLLPYWIYAMLPLVWLGHLTWHIFRYGKQNWVFLLTLWIIGSIFAVLGIFHVCIPIIESIPYTPFQQIVGHLDACW